MFYESLVPFYGNKLGKFGSVDLSAFLKNYKVFSKVRLCLMPVINICHKIREATSTVIRIQFLCLEITFAVKRSLKKIKVEVCNGTGAVITAHLLSCFLYLSL